MADAKQTIFGSAFFNFNVATGKLIMAKNIGIFWMTAVPLSLVVVCLSTMWYSMTSKFQEKRRADFFHNFANLALPNTFHKAAQALSVIMLYIDLLIRLVFSRRFFGERLAFWLQNRRVNPGMPDV